MGFLDKLKKIFETKLNINLSKFINIDKSIHIHITDKGQKYSADKLTNTVNINYSELKEELKSIIRPIEESYPILGEKSEHLREDFKLQDSSSENQEILQFFKDKIPETDHKILRAALYMRKQFELGNREIVKRLKIDIIGKYGDKGKNITNLCTAGYFEKFIKPMCEIKPTDEFKKFYELIIAESPYAIFIHKGMNKTEIERTIAERMEKNLKYRIKPFKIKIHGIGKENCSKIRETITKLEERREIDFTTEIREKDEIIIVTLTLT